MLRSLYKRILGKLSLTPEQMLELKRRLTIDNVSIGPFVNEDKMCPNTNALSIKIDKVGFSNKEVRGMLNDLGVSNLELWLFYILFDLPSLLSKNIASKNLKTLRSAIDDIIKN